MPERIGIAVMGSLFLVIVVSMFVRLAWRNRQKKNPRRSRKGQPPIDSGMSLSQDDCRDAFFPSQGQQS